MAKRYSPEKLRLIEALASKNIPVTNGKITKAALKTIENSMSTVRAGMADEINKETLDKIIKDSDLRKAVKELRKLEVEAEKLKKEVAPIYNKILEKYDFKHKDGSRITDYNKLYMTDNDTKEYYEEANKELMKKYPGTKDGHCPHLVKDHERINKENEVLKMLGKYYSFVKNVYMPSDRKKILDIHKQLFGVTAKVMAASRTSLEDLKNAVEDKGCTTGPTDDNGIWVNYHGVDFSEIDDLLDGFEVEPADDDDHTVFVYAAK